MPDNIMTAQAMTNKTQTQMSNTSGPQAFLNEYGRIGQRRVGGFYAEEFLLELRGKRGIQVINEMISNDEIVGAVATTIELLLRQADFMVEPGGQKTTVDRKAAEFVESCMDDMQMTWSETISEILSFIPFGWSYHEIVYKIRRGINSADPRWRSKFDDGMIGWLKLPIRSQDTLFRWEVDDNDNLLGMTQIPPPAFRILTVPIEKALHFRTSVYKNNPEGRSMWRRAYRSWYFKKRIQEIEGIGIERDLAGLPLLKGPKDMDLFDKNNPQMVDYLKGAEALVTNIRRDAKEGIVLPEGWELSLLSTGGRRSFDTSAIIERYNTGMTMTALADFMTLGHTKVGTYALSSNKTDMFNLAMGAFLDMICEVFNIQAIPRLIELNKDSFKGLTGYPEMTHGDLDTPDLKELGDYIFQMTGCGVIIPGPDLEKYARRVANLPEEENASPDNPLREPRQMPPQAGGKQGMNKPSSANKDPEGDKTPKATPPKSTPPKPTVQGPEEDDDDDEEDKPVAKTFAQVMKDKEREQDGHRVNNQSKKKERVSRGVQQ